MKIMTHLERDFHSKYGGEEVVEIIEDLEEIINCLHPCLNYRCLQQS